MLITLGTIILYLFALSMVYLTGFLVFTGFYFRFKSATLDYNRFLLVAVGWAFNIFAVIIFLFNIYGTDELLRTVTYIASGTCFTIGTLSIAIGMISYFLQADKKVYLLIYGLYITIPLIVYVLSDNSLTSTVLNLERASIYALLIVVGLYNRKKVLEFSRSSFMLFLVGTSLTLLLILITELFKDIEIFVILYFGFDIWISVILILYLVHLEQAISLQGKFIVKDAYSHDLANTLQKATGFIDIAIKTQKEEDYEKAQDHIMSAKDLLQRIRKL